MAGYCRQSPQHFTDPRGELSHSDVGQRRDKSVAIFGHYPDVAPRHPRTGDRSTQSYCGSGITTVTNAPGALLRVS